MEWNEVSLRVALELNCVCVCVCLGRSGGPVPTNPTNPTNPTKRRNVETLKFESGPVCLRSPVRDSKRGKTMDGTICNCVLINVSSPISDFLITMIGY